jgi:hypothetical protein
VNVGQLIEKLQRCPQDAEVFISDSELGHDSDTGVWLVDAWLGESYPGGQKVVRTHDWGISADGASCKAVVISPWGEDGERL